MGLLLAHYARPHTEILTVPTGTVNNNVQTVYEHDKADNRKKVTTTGSGNTPPS